MKANVPYMPDLPEMEEELRRLRERQKFRAAFSTTIFTLVSVVAIAVLVCVLILPVFRIYGTSMNPTLYDGEIVISVKGADFEIGDLIAFYYNNKILVKRVIANSGDWVYIGEDGTVKVNDKTLDEPYVSEKAFGECDLEFPYQVPENRYFVLGDHRLTSVDSLSNSLGCVADEQVMGKLVYRVWPLSKFGKLK